MYVQMTSVIGERETKVTQALQTMGMMRSAYWLSWITWETLLSFVITMITIAFGAACQINFFLKNAFGNVFFTLFTFQLAMVGFAYFVASFIRKTSTAISLGFAIFLIGFVFQVRACWPAPALLMFSDSFPKQHRTRFRVPQLAALYVRGLDLSLVEWCERKPRRQCISCVL